MQVCMYSKHALDESAARVKRFFGSIGDMAASQISDYIPLKNFPKILDECAIVYSFTMFCSPTPFAKTFSTL